MVNASLVAAAYESSEVCILSNKLKQVLRAALLDQVGARCYHRAPRKCNLSRTALISRVTNRSFNR